MIETVEAALIDSKSVNIRTPLGRRRELGAFFTPPDLTKVISEWAIRSPGDLVLEPSFGGCGFLAAAVDRLSVMGTRNPAAQLFGCDIDVGAFDSLATLGPKVAAENFVLADFLSVFRTPSWPPAFDVVIGNPPYIGYHNLNDDQRAVAIAAANNSPLAIRLQKNASLWAYFLLHSISFVRAGGRLAFVLPKSFLDAEYAADLRELVGREFARTAVVAVHQKLFKSEGTEERTLCLFAEGRGAAQSSPMVIGEAANVVELALLLEKWRTRTWDGTAATGRSMLALLPPKSRALYDGLLVSPHCELFGDNCTIRIGAVTGRNEFFVMNSCRSKELELPKSALKPIVAKFAQVKGLKFDDDDQAENLVAGARCLLFSPNPHRMMAQATLAYIATLSQVDIDTNRTFGKRDHWYQADDGRRPDAFLSYLHDLGPRMSLNGSQANCTNTIHRGYFKADMSEHRKKLLAVSLLCTFSQLSAEIEGRSYGSGVLKLEPSEFGRVRILMPPVTVARLDAAFKRIDLLLRAGEHDNARKAADALILGPHGVNLDVAEIEILRGELERLRNTRRWGVARVDEIGR
ncbi:SAM-dependent methyltransferase [Paraburkholderia sp. SEWSISQ10-3 4]|uniref:HsdM family class I SAM-dependent methyltransferase n=1 Tax=Paraburkholderia TaxID=1822464 RepID=UPI002250F017|nr:MULTISPECIES: N-6 DNA methylase [Paraburkholderia]MCX4139344.1 N-6 DNA methylase [Paraburkholderia aspalathi]MDN7172032.1 SAM-dependent methyltransferase [Paraburkholderia sp. SEWSISQ10-3 4]MDQ6501671.1 SAM-dependent methyltransferase [Paraburkholderia aspalathi]